MINIDISNNGIESICILSGDIDNVLNNRRLIASLKRLAYESFGNRIVIPIPVNTEVPLIQEITSLLEKFNLVFKLSENIENELTSFSRENKQFSDFSKQADLIKNNKFDEYPELMRVS